MGKIKILTMFGIMLILPYSLFSQYYLPRNLYISNSIEKDGVSYCRSGPILVSWDDYLPSNPWTAEQESADTGTTAYRNISFTRHLVVDGTRISIASLLSGDMGRKYETTTNSIAPNGIHTITISTYFTDSWGSTWYNEANWYIPTLYQYINSNPKYVFIDTIAPYIDSVSLDNGSESDGTLWTMNDNPIINAQCTENSGKFGDIEITGINGKTYSTSYSSSLSSWSFTGTEVISEGKYDINITIYDVAGNSTVYSTKLGVDKTPPDNFQVTTTPSISRYTNSSVILSCTNTADSGSPLVGYRFSADGANWTDLTLTQSYGASSNGTIYCQAVDLAGNIAEKIITVANIDTDTPSLQTPIAAFSPNGNELVISLAAIDETSGIANCQISMTPESGAAMTTYTVSQQAPNGMYIATFDLLTEALYEKTPSFSVIAVDKAGNASETYEFSLAIPKRITLSANPSVSEQAGKEYMSIDIGFGLTVDELKRFDQFIIERTPVESTVGVTLESLIIHPQTIPSSITTTSASPSSPWKLDGNGNVIYTDFVLANSEAGHKAWNYTLTATFDPRSSGASESWGGIDGSPSLVSFPNNKGALLIFNVLDEQGNPCPDGGTLQIGSDGTVQIELQGSDQDGDDWTLEIDKVKEVDQAGYAFTSRQQLGGKDKIAYTYSNGYATMLVPVNLSYGDNNVQVSWTEGSCQTTYRSAVFDLVLEHALSGGYTLSLYDSYGNQVGDSPAGIVCAPGQPLTLSIDSDDPDADPESTGWVFGDDDNSVVAYGAAQTHTYAQSPLQTMDTYTYDLRIDLPTAQSIHIPVTVQDTQEGELWMSELWRGDHTIIGEVVIPSGMSLAVAAGNTLSFKGSVGSGYSQGIRVRAGGSLAIDGGVTLAAQAGQERGWGAIIVEGSAAIGSTSGEITSLRDADRAIAVDSGASLTLANVLLSGNSIGLHVVGTHNVTIDGSKIIDNALYGVKEDAGGRPTLRTTTIHGNFRNYYQWDGGLLSIDQVNGLGQNSGNQGE